MKHNAKGAWYEVGGKRSYYRSKKEYVYALYLQSEMQKGKIVDWEHEPETFFFPDQKRGPVNYRPDFKVKYPDGCHAWHEVKGWMDPKSKSKIKKFKKYYPNEKLYVNGKLA